MTIIYLALALLVLMGLSKLIWMYVFSIYEVNYNSTYCTYADNQKIIKINCLPLNSLGLIPPFRKPKYKVEVTQGTDLINEIENVDNTIQINYLESESKPISILIYCNLSLLPYHLVIN